MSIFKQANSQLDSILAKKKNQSFQTDRNTLLNTVAGDVAKLSMPMFKQALTEVIKGQNITIKPPIVNVPPANVNVSVPTVNVPEPKVTVNVPPVRIPEFPRIPKLEWPDSDMPIKGFVGLEGVSKEHPLPVELRNSDGSPFKFGDGSISSVSGGGIAKRVKVDNPSSEPVNVAIVSGANNTSATNIVDSTGVAYSGSNPVPVVFGASATQAVNLVDSTGVAYTGDNPVPVDLVDVSSLATSAKQLPDGHNVTVDNASIAVTGTFYQATQPVSGTVAVSGITATTAVSIVDSTGVQYSSSNPVPIDDAGGSITVDSATFATSAKQLADNHNVTVSGITASTKTTIIDSSGVGYSGSNPIPITEVNVRGSYKTAYASLTNGTETTILTGEASYYHDLVWVMGANQSDAAITVDLRETTGGTVMATLVVPGGGTAGIAPTLPLPQTNISGAWTADMPDDTGAVVDITALFKKEV